MARLPSVGGDADGWGTVLNDYLAVDHEADGTNKTPTTTRGDIIRRGAAVNERLGLGTSGQVLSSDGTDVVWANKSPTTTRGDIIRRGASADERLALGTSGQVLSSNGTDAVWTTLTNPSSPTTTQGDLIVRGAATDERLAIGNDGDVLTMATGVPAWAPPATQSPTTTEGDLIVRGASVDARLAIGANGTVLGSNGTTAAWVSPSVGTGSVLNWTVVRPGANSVVGNGSTDDTTAIQALITAAGAGGTVYFAPAVYITDGLTMSDAGQRWIISAGATLRMKASGTNGGIDISGANCLIEGPGTIDGNKANRTAIKSIITVGWPTQPTGVVLRNLQIINSLEYGVKVYNDGGAGCDDTTIEGCTFTGNDRDAIYASLANHRLRIRNNRITTTSGSYNAISVYNDSDDAEVSGNYIDGPNRMGIEVWSDGGLYDPGCTRAHVVGNRISGSTWFAISVAGLSHYSVVANNTITDTDLAGIEIADAYDCSVTGNVIHDTAEGMSIDTTRGTSVTGNTIRNVTGKGIHVLDSTTEFGTITGNVIDAWSASDAAIYVQNAVGGTISGNELLGAGQTGVMVDGSTTAAGKVIISGNRFQSVTTAISLYQASTGSVSEIDIGPNQYATVTTRLATTGTVTAVRNTERLIGTATYNPASLANGAAASTTVTVIGAAVGDMVLVSHSAITTGRWLAHGYVSAANTVNAYLVNNTGGTVDLASGTLTAVVWKI